MPDRRPFRSSRRVSVLCAALSLTVVGLGLRPSVVGAQVSSTWISDTDGNWNDITRWQGNAIPNGGGSATFLRSTGLRTVTLPSGFTAGVSTVTFSSALVYAVDGSGSLSLAGSGGTRFEVGESATEAPAFDTAYSHFVLARISGAGPLVKSGPGTLTLTNSTNSYSGGTQINGGMLEVIGPSGVLGAGSGTLAISGGTLRLFGNGGSPFITSRDTSIGPAGARIDLRASATFSNSFSGSGNLTITSSALTNVLAVSRSNTLSGSLAIRNATMVLTGALSILPGTLPDRSATLLNLSSLSVSGVLHLDNRIVANGNRLSDSLLVGSWGSELILTGNDSADASESLGQLVLASGLSVLTVNPGFSSQTQLSVQGFDRSNGRGTVTVRGNGLGSPPDFGIASVQLRSVATGQLIGAGGAAGSTQQSVLPFVLGTTNSTSLITGAALVTRDAGSGNLRPLTPGEFASGFGASGDNVRLTSATSLPVSATANSLTLADNGSLSGGGTLTLSSGAVVLGASGTTLSAPLLFPGQVEGILHVLTPATVSSAISGTGGLTRSGPGNLTLSGSQSTYTGVTTLLSGTTFFSGNLPADGTTPSAFGRSTTAIVLAPGNNLLNGITLRLLASTDSVINRSIDVRGSGSGTVVLGNATGAESVTINGNISLGRPLQLFFDAALPAVLNGVISGSGYLTDSDLFPSGQVLAGNNTYAGGTLIRHGRYIAASNTAFGTGPIYGIGVFNSLTNSVQFGSVEGLEFSGPRTFANPLVISVGLQFEGIEELTFTGDVDLAGNPDAALVVNASRVVFAGPVRSGGFVKSGPGTLVLTSDNNPMAGPLVVSDGVLEIAAPHPATPAKVLDNDSISLAANTLLLVTPTSAPGQASHLLLTRSLTITEGAFFDLGDADLIVRKTTKGAADAALASLSSSVALWSTAADGLPGIVGLGSSSAFYTVDGAFATLAVFDNDPADNGVPALTSFAGVAVGPYDVLVKYTYLGDTNLDGVVDATDIARILQGMNGLGSGWNFGDVNYDGLVNTLDLGRALAALRGQGAPLSGVGAGGAGGAIPEPSALGLLIGPGLLLGRRRAARRG